MEMIDSRLVFTGRDGNRSDMVTVGWGSYSHEPQVHVAIGRVSRFCATAVLEYSTLIRRSSVCARRVIRA